MEPLGKADSVVSEQSGQPSERDAEPSGSGTYWGALPAERSSVACYESLVG